VQLSQLIGYSLLARSMMLIYPLPSFVAIITCLMGFAFGITKFLNVEIIEQVTSMVVMVIFWFSFSFKIVMLVCLVQGYAWEITTVEGGYGLHELLSSRRSVLNGIFTKSVSQDYFVVNKFCISQLTHFSTL